MQSFILAKGDRSKVLARLLAFLPLLSPAKAWQIVVSEYRPRRSDAQNNALWGVAYKAIREATGNSNESLHDHFCRKYFGEVEREICGTVRTHARRTTTTDEDGKRSVLSTVEFMGFYEFIQQEMASFGVYVPDPREMT